MRNIKLDNIKGALIFLVVFAHMLITYRYIEFSKYNEIIHVIYFFHMPIFFLIAGELSKKIDIKRIKYYGIIFLLMQESFIIYDYFVYGSFSLYKIAYSSWFILFLLLYRMIIYSKTINHFFTRKYSVLITFIIVVSLGFLHTYESVHRFLYFFLFFLIGYKYKMNYSKKKSLIILPIVICFILIISSISSLNLLMGASYAHTEELLIRIIIINCNIALYNILKAIIPNKKIPFITEWGISSLYIYAIHRIPTLLLSDSFYIYKSYIWMSIIIAIIICFIIQCMKKWIKQIFQSKFFSAIILIVIGILCLSQIAKSKELDIKTQKELEEDISIGFIGDLILLEDQLKKSNNNFDYLFDNMKEYFQETDYMISVLEGPVDDTNDYSYGNFDDGKELRLNYPTSFLRSIKEATIQLVSIANNHLLDKGESSFNNTLKNLNDYNLDYIGEKNQTKIISIKGIKIGILAYSAFTNYEEEIFKEKINYLVEPSSKEFKKVKDTIKKDFQKLKQENVDIIIVMPHYGTQFSERIDAYQEFYNRLFIDLGANIILGDHAHTIQPIYYNKNSIIVNCPGNYINSYIDYNGDISMFVKIFIGKDKKIKGSSITPIIAEKNENDLYYPVTMEMNSKKAKRAKNILSRVIFNKELKDSKNTYYYLKDKQVKYDNKYNLKLSKSDKESYIYQEIEKHNRICFIGDSITDGMKNNHHPWYEVLMSFFTEKEVINISKGGYTTSDIIENFSDIIKSSNCDLNIINIGTNDIRYYKRDKMEYIKNMKEIISYMDGDIIVLAPWQTTKRDYNIDKKDKTKRKLFDSYNKELQKLENVYYINPNNYIKEVIEYNGESYYLLDGIHPNEKEGIKLYSYSVLRSE